MLLSGDHSTGAGYTWPWPLVMNGTILPLFLVTILVITVLPQLRYTWHSKLWTRVRVRCPHVSTCLGNCHRAQIYVDTETQTLLHALLSHNIISSNLRLYSLAKLRIIFLSLDLTHVSLRDWRLPSLMNLFNISP